MVKSFPADSRDPFSRTLGPSASETAIAATLDFLNPSPRDMESTGPGKRLVVLEESTPEAALSCKSESLVRYPLFELVMPTREQKFALIFNSEMISERDLEMPGISVCAGGLPPTAGGN